MNRGIRSRFRHFVQRTAIWIPVGVIGLLMLPLVATSRSFGDDWTKHLWMVRQQQLNIRANGRPGLFLSATVLGVFYPIFAFVGSGIYTVGGYLAIVLGDRPILAYKLLYLFALCLAYGGMTWLARQVGLRGWQSQMPGLVLVTGAYFVTDMFARGDLGELSALSAIPFLIAAVVAVAMSTRLTAAHLLAVAVGMFVLTGSHNITLLFGTIFIGLLAVVVLVAYSPSRLSELRWHRLPALAAAAAIGTGLNAWYLAPDIKYSLDTVVAVRNRGRGVSAELSQWRLLLDPLRPADSAFAGWSHDMRLSLPWPFALWAIVVAFVVWRRIDGVGRCLLVLLTGLAGLYVFLLVSSGVWSALPRSLSNLQYLWRLHAYVLLATALLTMVALVWQTRANERTRRASNSALAVIAVFMVGAATWQAWIVPSTYFVSPHDLSAPSNLSDIVVHDDAVRPISWGGFGDFRISPKPPVSVGFASRLVVPESKVRGSSFSGLVNLTAGTAPFLTNISAGPAFVDITGIKPIGLSDSGLVVAERLPGTAPTGPVHVTIRQAHTRLLRFGEVVSMLSLAALGALIAWTILAWLRTRFTRAPLTMTA